MKRSVWQILLTLILASSSCLLWADQPASSSKTSEDNQPAKGLPKTKLSIKEKSVTVEVANTKKAWEKGLRFRKSLQKNTGMLFVFPDAASRALWMKDASIPLCAAFMDEQGVILNLAEMKPLTEISYSSLGPAQFVLLMHSGWFEAGGIKPGDKISGVLEAPPSKEPSDKPPYALNDDQLAWGKTQIQQMIKDRPAMASYVQEGDDLWNWTVRQYAGEYVKGGVEWDSGSPAGSFDSTAVRPDPVTRKKAYIQDTRDYASKDFHQGEGKTAPALWWEMAMEFCNLMNGFLYDSIDQAANEGRIGRADNAFEYMAGEDIAAVNKSHDLFYGLWIPHCRKLHLPFEDKRFTERFGKIIGRGWSRQAFVKAFQSIEKKNDAPKLSDWDQFIEKDFRKHYDWYTGLYDKNTSVYLKKVGIAVPVPKPSEEVETQFLDKVAPSSAASTVVQKLEPEGNSLLMDDFENGVGVNQFGAVWHSAMDHRNLGTQLKNYPFEPREGGAPGSPKYAARIWGHWGKHMAPWPWVTLRDGFNPEETPADLSAFSGVRFFAKGDKKSYLLQLVQPAVKDSDYYRASFQAPAQWAPVTLSFGSFQQSPWGVKVPLAWDQVQCFQFTPNDEVFNNEDFDLWIDDIVLLK